LFAASVPSYEATTMPRQRGEIDTETRDRIRAWIRYEMGRRDIESMREFARKIAVSHTYVQRVLAGEQHPGFEFVLRMHRKLHISLDRLVDEDPPKR
jgi:ribosome-binding protein aMBF1 (putative translation factor)